MVQRTSPRRIKMLRYVLLAACLAVLAGLAHIFWLEARAGRASRETERVQDSRERVTAPDAPQTIPAPAAPAQEPRP